MTQSTRFVAGWYSTVLNATFSVSTDLLMDPEFGSSDRAAGNTGMCGALSWDEFVLCGRYLLEVSGAIEKQKERESSLY